MYIGDIRFAMDTYYNIQGGLFCNKLLRAKYWPTVQFHSNTAVVQSTPPPPLMTSTIFSVSKSVYINAPVCKYCIKVRD